MTLRNPVETVRFKQHIDRLLAEILRRRFQVHGRMTTWRRIGEEFVNRRRSVALSAHLEPPGFGQPGAFERRNGRGFRNRKFVGDEGISARSL